MWRRKAAWWLGWVAIALGTPRIAPRKQSPPASLESLTVYTFVNDDTQYHEMRESFAASGFESLVSLRDDESDPYEAINRIGGGDGYAVLCHQDVRLDQGAGLNELHAVIADLNARDPSWAVAGNAGVTPKMRVVRRLVDWCGNSTDDVLPARVVSLDENFLLLNCRQSPRCSPELSGFHLYGTDVCLNALADGATAYVIDFPVTHLGSGHQGESYEEIKSRFLEVWNQRYRFLYIGTPVDVFFISRFRLLRRVFALPRVTAWVWLHRKG